ncbi:nucleoside triphosphate pyrophosphohydrolase [Paenibacillus hunanensis]|uniref:nucleoside triphosphate pyrophosphohydrolase n=1 Tax=Paenibacillus hunanensis TaxID=539262 RepID=UPI002025DA96|nr:nucleoside triphosphate pyrophosphohydrolase [Paenibacillus hunanensis]MCL9662197.1 nucleoside triphosphate pyrophosphohydrolase [Paenibacillus hunanensis]
MKVYNKLIRDRIPEIIEASGKKANVEIMDNAAYLKELNHKLQEELDEYNEEQDINELADLIEVAYAILEHKGIDLEEFEKLRLKKQDERGGFKEKLFLVSVTE